MLRWRAIFAFSLAFVMATASVGACAVLCDLAQPAQLAEVPARTSSCHQAAAVPAAKPLAGPGFGMPNSHCPALAALADGRHVVVPAAAQASAHSFGAWPASLPASALEILLPRRRVSLVHTSVSSHPSALPLYLERGVLRI